MVTLLKSKKCKVMHFGINNPGFHYKMFDRTGKEVLLGEHSSEKDLGIFFSK